MSKLRKLPITSKKGVIGYIVVLDDDYTRSVLSKMKWNLTKAGYAISSYSKGRGKRGYYYLHRLVYAHYIGEAVHGMDVDHKDKDKLNNIPDNLRLVSRSVNIANSRKRRNNTSGFKGVSWDKVNNKWMTTIQVHGKSIPLGRYLDKFEAARAVNQGYRKYFPDVDIPNPEAELELKDE